MTQEETELFADIDNIMDNIARLPEKEYLDWKNHVVGSTDYKNHEQVWELTDSIIRIIENTRREYATV